MKNICTMKNALNAYQKARRCKRYRPEVLEFEANREDLSKTAHTDTADADEMDVDRGGEIYLIHGVSFLRALLSASQTGCSLMGLKKTNAAFAALVFFGTHYIITTFTLKCYWIFCQMYCQLYAFFLCTCIKTCCFPDLCYIKFERYS